MKSLQPELERRKQAHLYRARRVYDSPQGPEGVVDGRHVLSFCSNDYLGLANHPEVIAAMQRGAETYGAGSGAAHLVSGHSRAHHVLEEELAEFTGRPRALLFSTGYMANLGVMSALLGRGDSVYEDRLNHASLIDGGLLSRANFKRYAHADMDALQSQLQGHAKGEALVAIDGVFSMDGDIAPLDRMATLCRGADAWLMVDDAHGFGVLGEQGRGTIDRFNLGLKEVPIMMGTLGKAVGTSGAFVAGSDELIETLIQQARSYIFTTATPPAVAEATRASLRLVQKDEWRRERLKTLIGQFRQGAEEIGLPLMESETPIQPIVAGTSEQALKWSRQLEGEGIQISAIRPPTVPEGSARLRITFSASHTPEHVERLLEVLSGLELSEA
ncbi:8-amino-7-oxononanoate synthase [Solemya velesiana gill symbiont]|uniref:8-amino-7-oxononanoate synthase n=1 Tax=Solemya velesiana gill symbiont TaxID=1918948 RepID=UPI001FE337D7|nr:8-amino-7-oxononanoate synthase [Solemya velesiana gill symbiont]